MKLSSFIIHLFPFNIPPTPCAKINNRLNPSCISDMLIKKCLDPAFTTEKTFIKNAEFPICTNCVHFIEHKNNDPLDPVNNDKKYGRCKKFGQVEVVSGFIEYDFAEYCRKDSNKCGKSGTEFIEKTKPTL